MEIYIIALIALVAGAGIGWILSSRKMEEQRKSFENESMIRVGRISELEKEIAVITEKHGQIERQFAKKELDHAQLDHRNRELEQENVSLREQNKSLSEKFEQHKLDLEHIQLKFTDQFKVLADQILEEKSTKFTKQNETNIRQILDPLGERLNEFKRKVEDTYNLEMKERVTLQEQIRSLTTLNQGMQEEARNLTKALKGDSKVQGNWGEIILERILEKSGLQRDREYRIQVSGSNDDGRRIQPDVIIDLPEDRHIVIDSKVSITAFEKFSSAENDEMRDQAIKEHLISVRSHIRGLSEKNYQSMYEINSPDFVLMFIPIEPAFALTIQMDQQLYNDAMEKNIVIVSPTTLLATLSTISSIWKQEYRTRNALKIAEQGGKLYEKFVGFYEDLEGLGQRLGQAQKSYDQAMNKLKTGRGHLLGQAEKLRKLGVKATKRLPKDALLDSVEVDDEDIEEDNE